MNKQIAYDFLTNQNRSYTLRSRMKAGTLNPVYGISASISKMDEVNRHAMRSNHPDTDLDIS